MAYVRGNNIMMKLRDDMRGVRERRKEEGSVLHAALWRWCHCVMVGFSPVQ